VAKRQTLTSTGLIILTVLFANYRSILWAVVSGFEVRRAPLESGPPILILVACFSFTRLFLAMQEKQLELQQAKKENQCNAIRFCLSLFELSLTQLIFVGMLFSAVKLAVVVGFRSDKSIFVAIIDIRAITSNNVTQTPRTLPAILSGLIVISMWPVYGFVTECGADLHGFETDRSLAESELGWQATTALEEELEMSLTRHVCSK
jgi:hypothetical protein